MANIGDRHSDDGGGDISGGCHPLLEKEKICIGGGGKHAVGGDFGRGSSGVESCFFFIVDGCCWIGWNIGGQIKATLSNLFFFVAFF